MWEIDRSVCAGRVSRNIRADGESVATTVNGGDKMSRKFDECVDKYLDTYVTCISAQNPDGTYKHTISFCSKKAQAGFQSCLKSAHIKVGSKEVRVGLSRTLRRRRPISSKPTPKRRP